MVESQLQEHRAIVYIEQQIGVSISSRNAHGSIFVMYCM